MEAERGIWSQVVLGALLSSLAASILIFWFSLADLPASPPLSAAIVASAFVLFTLLFLPLVWWQRKAGYAGALVIGVFSVIALGLGIAGAFGPLAAEVRIGSVSNIIIALVLIGASYAAWRE